MRALQGCFFRPDKFPTATGSAEVPGASQQLNNRLGQTVSSCPTLQTGASGASRGRRETIELAAGHHLRGRPAFFRPFALAEGAEPAIRKSSCFFPDLRAAVNHRGFNPRPAQVSVAFSGLRYLGATDDPFRPPIRRIAGFERAVPPAMAKSSSFLPDLIAAANHRGFNPRPAQVSLAFSGLRYLGATDDPFSPPRPAFARAPPTWNRLIFESSDSRARR